MLLSRRNMLKLSTAGGALAAIQSCGNPEDSSDLVIHFTLVVNQAILGLAPLAAKIGAIERGLSKASGGVH